MNGVTLIKEGTALVDSGPLYMTIQVSESGVFLSEIAESGAAFALEILRQQAEYLSLIKQKALQLSPSKKYPDVINNMILATKALKDPSFTPLAAVAGAASDLVADYVVALGATKVIVNNGGDIAIRLREKERATVGLRLNLKRPAYDYVIQVEEDCGICTSGFGGRSFTLGVADGVAVLADQAVIADAVATYLGNKTVVDSPEIKRALAESIYPDTDIPGARVTQWIGSLTQEQIDIALTEGQKSAQPLMESKMIRGAVFSVKDHVVPIGCFIDSMKKI